MTDTSGLRELNEEIRQYTNRYCYEHSKVPSDKAGDLVERVVAVDSTTDQYLPDTIKLLASFLPQDEHFTSRLTTLFNKAVSLGSYAGERLIHDLFYRNPDVLAEPLIDFVRQDPMGKRQTKLLTDIFNPAILRRDAIGCYPPASYDQKILGLKTAAGGIDTLHGRKQGILAIVECVITSFESERAAKEKHREFFYS